MTPRNCLLALAATLCLTATARLNTARMTLHAQRQMENMVASIPRIGLDNPCTLLPDSTIQYISPQDWRSGFFPGSLWYMYELTGDNKWKSVAQEYCRYLTVLKDFKGHHDVGFMVGCSIGNGLRITGKQTYKNVMVQAARSLCTRFRPDLGVIQSWNLNKKLRDKGCQCPVIIDNLMNLELLYEATRLTGDSSFHQMAVSHMEHTLKNHFRPDGSCYHLVDYDTLQGGVHRKITWQGLTDSSAWARGQAWAIYGMTLSYRYTRDARCLEQALKTFRFMKHHPHMPKDGVPYWDMDAYGSLEPRDASAAVIIASALLELEDYTTGKTAQECHRYACKILKSLAGPDYTAANGRNGNFLLMHSVSHKTAGIEVDVPLNYADYYYLEALVRLKSRKLRRNN